MKRTVIFASILIPLLTLAQDPIFDPAMNITAYGLVNSPVGEEVDKIIDGDIATKFLDFELGDGMGFTVDLGGMSRAAFSIDITTANDFPVRDPIDFEVLGSQDGVGFTQLGTGSIVCIPDRFTTRSYSFVNATPYAYYRVNFSAPCDPSGGTGIPSIQVAEVQLFEEILGLSESNLLDKQVQLFPNPSNGEFSISYTGSDTLTGIDVLDVNGKLIHNGHMVRKGEQHFRLSNLKSGLYFLRITSSKTSVTKKLLVN